MKTLLCAVLALAAGAARADTLTFDDAHPNLPPVLRLGAEIDPSYGDTAEVDVDSGLYADFLSTRKADQPVVYYETYAGRGYGAGAPSGVAISSVDGGVAEFSFTARQPGKEIVFESFAVSSFPNGESDIQGGFVVLDGDLNVLWSSLLTVGGPVETVAVGVAAADRLLFRWGYSFDIGVDDIAFSLRDAPVSAVPLPTTAPLLLAGLALFGALRRRG